MTLVAVTVFVIPAFIITACYTIIVFTIWSKSKLLTPTTRKTRHMKSESASPITRNKFSAARNSFSPTHYLMTMIPCYIYLPQRRLLLAGIWRILFAVRQY
jgi:hypothetical protein